MVGTDTKAREQLASQLKHLGHHLAKLVFSRTAELAESRDAAEAAILAKCMFLASTGHELRLPVNGSTGMTPKPLPKQRGNGMPIGSGWWCAVRSRQRGPKTVTSHVIMHLFVAGRFSGQGRSCRH